MINLAYAVWASGFEYSTHPSDKEHKHQREKKKNHDPDTVSRYTWSGRTHIITKAPIDITGLSNSIVTRSICISMQIRKVISHLHLNNQKLITAKRTKQTGGKKKQKNCTLMGILCFSNVSHGGKKNGKWFLSWLTGCAYCSLPLICNMQICSLLRWTWS